MNILHLTRTMGTGGTEKVILQLTRLLVENGDTVFVASMGGKHEIDLKNINAQHINIRDLEKKNPIDIFSNLLKIKSAILQNNIEVVHTHHRMAAFYIRILQQLKMITVKHIHTQHNVFNDKIWLTNFSLKRCQIVAVGKNVSDSLTNTYKLNEKDVRVIYNSVDNSNIERQSCNIHNGSFTIINVGRLSEQKGMSYFIQAAFKIKNAGYKNVRYLVVGDGALREDLVREIAELHLQNDVTLLGFRRDVQELMMNSNLVVLSSLWEGLPLTPIEAFSCGKAVVATAVDGTPEIITNGFNGLLVRPKSSDDLSKKIEYLIDNQEKLEEFERNAKKTFDQKFSYVVFKDQYLNLYKEVESKL